MFYIDKVLAEYNKNILEFYPEFANNVWIDNNTILCAKHGEYRHLFHNCYSHNTLKYFTVAICFTCPECLLEMLANTSEQYCIYSNDSYRRIVVRCKEHGTIYDKTFNLYSDLDSFTFFVISTLRTMCLCEECSKVLQIKHQNELIKETFLKLKQIDNFRKCQFVNKHLFGVFNCDIHKEYTIEIAECQDYSCPHCLELKEVETFTDKAYEVHGSKYDYSLVTKIKDNEKIVILCEEHGMFEVTPKQHLRGVGCKFCKASSKRSSLETKLFNMLTKHSVPVIEQFPLIIKGHNRKIDFYIPTVNLFIECNGKQHYELVSYFHKSAEDFTRQIDRDNDVKFFMENNTHNFEIVSYLDDINTRFEELRLKYKF